MCIGHRCYYDYDYRICGLDHGSKHSADSCLGSFDVCACVYVGKVLSRDLTQQLNNAIQFLVHCRPLSISMGNAIKYVKLQASHLLSCAYQLACISKAFVPRLQFTSMGNAIRYFKLQASQLLSFAYQMHSVTQPQSISSAIKYVKLQANHLLSYAHQTHCVIWLQSISSAIKCVKLHFHFINTYLLSLFMSLFST